MGTDKHRMPVGSTLLPGRPGTKKLMAKYGDALVFVRYRYDKNARKRYTTVEMVQSEAAGDPPASIGTQKPPERRPRDRIGVRIGFLETELREKVKQISGILAAPPAIVGADVRASLCLGLTSHGLWENDRG